MKIDKSTLKALIKEVMLEEAKSSEELGAAFAKATSKPAAAKSSKELGTAFAKAASKPTPGAKKSNPAATRMDVMNKLNKKVGNMATKVIVAALEKDPKLMTTLSMVLKEEVEMELMEDDFDDLNPGKDAAEAAIMAAFSMNKDLPVDEIAKIAVKNLMRSFNITLKDEEKEEMSPEEYERLKMPGLDERRG